jgi:exodeoxyribonuclease V gamma subunit
MTKAQIHFSNKSETLLEIFKEELFREAPHPFEERLVVVPHPCLKSYLMQALAKDSRLQVAAGLQIIPLSKAYAKLTKQPMPTTLELSLFLQHALDPFLEREKELKNYFSSEAKERRIGPFCDTLASHFIRYGIYGKGELPRWQRELWKLLPWTFPSEVKDKLPMRKHLYLFGFSYLPQSYFELFKGANGHFYLFSPCQIFWGDFYSEKEKALLAKSVPQRQLDLFEKSFEDVHPLLAGMGKLGRKMLERVEECALTTEEHYEEVEEGCCLHRLQNALLYGEKRVVRADGSLRGFSATTLWREVEILKGQLLELFDTQGVEPKDVQVFAPDISLYAPYIQAVFSEIEFSITDLRMEEIDPTARAFARVLQLPKERFALEAVLQVVGSMKKFPIDMGKARRWLELANVQWGLSKDQRKFLYLNEMHPSQVRVIENTGTWEQGFRRLLIGLGHLEGDEAPLCCLETTDMEPFDTLYRLITSLGDDLAPLWDGTKWTISTWLRYFACFLDSYFEVDPSHELYKGLLDLASSSDHLDSKEVSYLEVKRVLDQLLAHPCKSLSPPHTQAIRFSSLSEGAVLPSRVLCFLGMQEESFPRREVKSSFFVATQDLLPTKTEVDRYLFLQALFAAKDIFLFSYVREAEGKLGVSPLIEELFELIDGAEIAHHPAKSYDPSYFQGEWTSYSQEDYALARATLFPKPAQEPLIPSFVCHVALKIQKSDPQELDLHSLFKFARHPLRYYVHEVLGFYPEVGMRPRSTEYLLDYRAKSSLVMQALQEPIDTVLERAEKRGELPTNLLKRFAVEQLEKELELWHEALEVLGIDPSELHSKQIDLSCSGVRLKGKIELFTSKGICIYGENKLEDQIRFWPQTLLAKELSIPLLCIKDQSVLEPKGSLEEYLDYFHLAQTHPSPLLPPLAKPLLFQTEAELKKVLASIEDETLNWLRLASSMPEPTILFNNWAPLLRSIFGGVCANV